jgi:hypothetical protein
MFGMSYGLDDKLVVSGEIKERAVFPGNPSSKRMY